MKQNSYYIYWYKNPLKDGEVFYIGYGNHMRKCGGCRAYDHVEEVLKGIISSNKHKYYTIRKILESGKFPIVEIIADNLAHVDAVQIEKCLLKQYKNTLVNIASGGEGGDTFTNQPKYKKDIIREKLRNKPPTIHSREWLDRLSIIRKGVGNPFYGKTHSKKTRKKCGDVWRGKTIPKELVDRRQTLSVYYIDTSDGNVLQFHGRKELESYFMTMNRNLPKCEKINWQSLLKGNLVKGYKISNIGSIKKSDI